MGFDPMSLGLLAAGAFGGKIAGSLFGGDAPSMPAPPAPPPPPVPPPQLPQAQGQTSGLNSRRQSLIAAGSGGTIATGPQGLTQPESGAPKSLLGG